VGKRWTLAKSKRKTQAATQRQRGAIARVASNPKSPPAARQAAASSLLDRASGKPSDDFEGGEALVIKVVRFAQEQIDENDLKVIEGAVVRDDDTTEN
jgi:hypothetical protein